MESQLLLVAVNQVWSDACERADARVSAERVALAAAVDNVRMQIDQIMEVAALYESQRYELAVMLHQVTSERDSALNRVRTLEAKADSLETLCDEKLEAIAARGASKKAGQAEVTKQ